MQKKRNALRTRRQFAKERTFGCYFVLVCFALAAPLLCSAQDPPASNAASQSSSEHRPKAFAAPTGANALELDGEMKNFFKVGAARDGVQKVVFDETQGNGPSPDFVDDQFGRQGPGLEVYDDNSVIESRNESPLWIPPLYRNETAEEKAATATTRAPPTLPPQTQAPIGRTVRPLVAPNLNNRAPIPVRTTPPPQFRPVQPFARPNQQQQLPQQQQFQVQQQFVQPQQSQQFVPQQQARPVVPQPQQFVPQQPQQPFVPQPQQFVPQRPQQPPQQPAPVQTPAPAPVPQPRPNRPQPRPVLSTNFPTQSQPNQPFRRPTFTNNQQQQQPRQQQFVRPQQQQLPPQQVNRPAPAAPQQPPPPPSPAPAPQPQPQAQPTAVTQPPRPLRPFQPVQNTVANQPPRNAAALRTGVCPNTIFYQTVLAAPFELQQTFSHFAMVVSVDQCARTCHEFNCAVAFFDPRTRHCQFNPSTVFSLPQGSCPQWPNPLYRNNIAIGGPFKISCVTCQRRRRNGPSPAVNNRFFNGQQPNNNFRRPAPYVFRTTNQNRFGQQQPQRIANAAAVLHGVAEQPVTEAIAVDEKYGRDRMESEAEWKDLEEIDSDGGSDPLAARTTIVPLLSSLHIQPLQTKKGNTEFKDTPSTLGDSDSNDGQPESISFRRSRRLSDDEAVSAEQEGEGPVLVAPASTKGVARNTKGVTTNKHASGDEESKSLVELPTN